MRLLYCNFLIGPRSSVRLLTTNLHLQIFFIFVKFQSHFKSSEPAYCTEKWRFTWIFRHQDRWSVIHHMFEPFWLGIIWMGVQNMWTTVTSFTLPYTKSLFIFLFHLLLEPVEKLTVYKSHSAPQPILIGPWNSLRSCSCRD